MDTVRQTGLTVIHSWDTLSLYDDDANQSRDLTSRQIVLIQNALTVCRWATRYTDLAISNDELDAWIDDILYRLDVESIVTIDCEDVANCVDNSEAVQNSLSNFVSTGLPSGGNPVEQITSSQKISNMLPDNMTCDNDHYFGMAVGIVNAIHEATFQFFQLIEVETNPVELANLITNNVPIADKVNVAAEVIAWVQDTIFETYNASWSDNTRDEIACEIYCLLLSNGDCSLSFEDIMTVYTDIDINPPALLDPWYDWFLWYSSILLIPEARTVKVGGLLGLSGMLFGAIFGAFSSGIRSIETTMQLLADDTNSDWNILCTECPSTWAHVWNFKTHGQPALTDCDHVFGSPAYDMSTFVEGEGIISGYMNNSLGKSHTAIQYAQFFLNEGGVHSSTKSWRLYYSMVKGVFDSNKQDAFYMEAGLNNTLSLGQGDIGTILQGDAGLAIDAIPDRAFIFCRMYASENVPDFPPGGNVTLIAIELSGDGDDPYTGRDFGDAPWEL